MALYFLAILDRGNISFAALQMNKDLGLNAEMFGISVGIMYFTYAIFEIPSNILLARYGARVTLTRIAVLWGIATVLMAFTRGPWSLYTFRGFLGFAESGLFPGVMLLLSMWFPFKYRARYNAMFNYAVPISYIFASLISGAILELDGTFGLPGWKWLFVLEGAPPIVLGIIGVFYLTDRPQQATWLSADQRSWLIGALEHDAKATGVVHGEGVLRTITKPMVLLFGFCNFGLFCGLASLFPWLPQIIKTFGLPVSQVGLVTAIPPIAGLIGMIALSRHSDRVGERFYYAVMTFVIAAAGFAIAAFATSPGTDHRRLHGRQCRRLRHPGGILDHPAILYVTTECARRDRPCQHYRQHRRRDHSGRNRAGQGRIGRLHDRLSGGLGRPHHGSGVASDRTAATCEG